MWALAIGLIVVLGGGVAQAAGQALSLPRAADATSIRAQAETAAANAWQPRANGAADAWAAELAKLGIGAQPLALPDVSLHDAALQFAQARGLPTTALGAWDVPAMPAALAQALARVLTYEAALPAGDLAYDHWAESLEAAYQAHDAARVDALLHVPPSDGLESVKAMAPAALGLAQAADALAHVVLTTPPVAVPDVTDPTGQILLLSGTSGHTRGGAPPALTVDLGSGNTYIGSWGCNGVVVVGGAGDTFEGLALCSQGAGLAGAGILENVAGHANYLGLLIRQGAGVGGLGALVDTVGGDLFVAGVLGQGSGLLGAGALVRAGTGNDVLGSVTASQGFGLSGAGLATGGRGDDTYILATLLQLPVPVAGQGAGLSLLGLPAGYGSLVDLGGNDQYILGAAGLGDLDGRGQGYGADQGAGVLVHEGGQNNLFALLGLGGGVQGPDASSSIAGQGAGTNNGVGVAILDDAQGATNAVYAASVGATLAAGLDQPVTGGSAHANALDQGAATHGGTGVLLGGLGNDVYSTQADALAIAGALAGGFSFGVGFDVAGQACNALQGAASYGFAETFAICSASAFASSASSAASHARSEAHVGDAIAGAHAQGYGSENGLGALIDRGGTDMYELRANSIPAVLSAAESLAVSASLSISGTVADALGAAVAFGSGFSAGQFAAAFGNAAALSVAFTQSLSEASASAVSSAVSEGVATAGDSVSTADGQGMGTLDGAGGLVDLSGPDLFILKSNSHPLVGTGALSESAAAAGAAAVAAALSVAEAGAGSLAVATGFDFAFDASGSGAFAASGCFTVNWFCTAFAPAIAAAFAAAFGVSLAAAAAAAESGAGADALAAALANALASASSSSASATSVGSIGSTTSGQGAATLNGVAAFLRLGAHRDVSPSGADVCGSLPTLPAAPKLPVTPPQPPASLPDCKTIVGAVNGVAGTAGNAVNGADPCSKAPTLPGAPAPPPLPGTPVPLPPVPAIPALPTCGSLVQSAKDAPGQFLATLNAITAGPQNDVVIQEARSDPAVLSLSGSFALALAEAVAAALSVAAATAQGLATAIAADAVIATAIAAAGAFAIAACAALGIGFWSVGVGACAAIALAAAAALAVAIAGAAAAAAALSVTVAAAGAQALALAHAQQDAGAASAASVSLGPVSATTDGQGRASTNGFAVYAGGDGNDLSSLNAVSDPTGDVISIAAGNGACTASSSLSIGGLTALANGQARADTNGVAAALDTGGDDTYALGARAANDLGTVAESVGPCSSSAGATAVSTGALVQQALGRGAADDRSVALFADLGGNDNYDGAGGANNQVSANAGAVHGGVFVDFDAASTVAGAQATAASTAACLQAGSPKACLPAPPGLPTLPFPLPNVPNPPLPKAPGVPPLPATPPLPTA